jgi:Asp-tRNA(Asn)/Glu-tRNA(Gln) amidotransferase A subunit family amidase
MQPAHEIAEGVRNGTLSPYEVLDSAINRIIDVDAQVEAWVEINDISARRRARELEAQREAGEQLGALAGVPVGVKDIIDVRQFTTRAGAPEFAHRTPQQDSNVARRLREAGAIILGKTHTTEFAYLDPAPTHNPWHHDHTPGGSSSGSAAAVAAGMVAMAIGSQTVGSVLRPAGYCGIVGFKPTFGRIGYSGVYALAASYDHLGLLVTSVRDAALGLSVIAGHDPADPNSLDLPIEDYVVAIATPRPPRLGVPRNYFHGTVEPENEAHLDEVIALLQKAGAHVSEVAFPATAPEIADTSMPLMRYEAAQAHAEMYARSKDDYRPSIKALVEAGIATSEADYERSRSDVAALRAAMNGLLTDVDALLLPTAPGTAPADLTTTGPGIFCGPASFTGLPSISLPSGIAPNGLPFSVQLIGPTLGESKLLNVAAWVEGVLDFRAKPALEPK